MTTAAAAWRQHWRRQRKLARLLGLQAAVLAPAGFLVNLATTVTASAGTIALHAAALFVVAPASISGVHVALESALVHAGRMPHPGETRETWLRIGCQCLGMALAAVLTAELLERLTPLRHLLAGPLFSAAALIASALAVQTLYEAVRARELALLRLRSLAAEARLTSLAEQVQPHFLFNVLNVLAEVVHADPAKGERGILALARMYRAILDLSAQPLVALADELALVRSYFEIQELRFGARLTTRFAVDPAAGPLRLPPFSVFNLVENAVKHGIARSVAGGWIEVAAAAHPGGWRLCVSNSAEPGAPPGAASGAAPARGLANIRERLRLVYGSAAELTLTFAGSATAATITLAGPPRGAAAGPPP